MAAGANHDDGAVPAVAGGLRSARAMGPTARLRRTATVRTSRARSSSCLMRPPQVATDHEKERIKALYYGEITYMDEWIGRLLNTIADLGRLQRHGDSVHLGPRDRTPRPRTVRQERSGRSTLTTRSSTGSYVIRAVSAPGTRSLRSSRGHDLFPTDTRPARYTRAGVHGRGDPHWWGAVCGRWCGLQRASMYQRPRRSPRLVPTGDVAITGWGKLRQRAE